MFRLDCVEKFLNTAYTIFCVMLVSLDEEILKIKMA